MSLTRDEWGKMWQSIKTIEQIADELAKDGRMPGRKAVVIRSETNRIKKQIESVIGAME